MKIIDAVRNASWNEKLKTIRVLKGWTQTEAAERCCVNQKVFWDWEMGNRFPQTCKRKDISRAFGVPEEEIFGKTEKQNKDKLLSNRSISKTHRIK
jgi:transcriptional regulator with XRE-family HTH domain